MPKLFRWRWSIGALQQYLQKHIKNKGVGVNKVADNMLTITHSGVPVIQIRLDSPYEVSLFFGIDCYSIEAGYIGVILGRKFDVNIDASMFTVLKHRNPSMKPKQPK